MEILEHTAKTYDDAVAEALEILGRTLDQVEIEVINQAPEEVTIRAKTEPRPIDEAREWLEDLLDAMDIDADVFLDFGEEDIALEIETDEDVGLLIGRKGQTLDAIQYLANVAFGQAVGKRLIVDVGDYRKRHEEKLIDQAHHAADRVRTTGKSYRLPPMSASDRRIVHTALVDSGDIETGSEGEEPNRYVVVHPKEGGQPRRHGAPRRG